MLKLLEFTRILLPGLLFLEEDKGVANDSSDVLDKIGLFG